MTLQRAQHEERVHRTARGSEMPAHLVLVDDRKEERDRERADGLDLEVNTLMAEIPI